MSLIINATPVTSQCHLAISLPFHSDIPMESLSSNPDHDGGEEGLAHGEGESAQRKSSNVQSSSADPANTHSSLNGADDRPESPSSAAYAVIPAQPMTSAAAAAAAAAAYEDVKNPR